MIPIPRNESYGEVYERLQRTHNLKGKSLDEIFDLITQRETKHSGLVNVTRKHDIVEWKDKTGGALRIQTIKGTQSSGFRGFAEKLFSPNKISNEIKESETINQVAGALAKTTTTIRDTDILGITEKELNEEAKNKSIELTRNIESNINQTKTIPDLNKIENNLSGLHIFNPSLNQKFISLIENKKIEIQQEHITVRVEAKQQQVSERKERIRIEGLTISKKAILDRGYRSSHKFAEEYNLTELEAENRLKEIDVTVLDGRIITTLEERRARF